MKKTLIYLRTFLFRIILFTAVSLFLNWVLDSREAIGKTILTAFLTLVIYSILEHFLLKAKKES
jgi:hypothetical protein